MNILRLAKFLAVFLFVFLGIPAYAANITLIDSSTRVVSFGLSGDGSTLVYNSASGTSGSVWTSQNGIVQLARLPGNAPTLPRATTQNGSIIVGSASPNGGNHVATVWGTPTTVSDYGISSVSIATGISNDGSVVVGNHNNSTFRWTQSTGVVGLDSLFSIANAVSGDGIIAVGSTPTGFAAKHETTVGGEVVTTLGFSGEAHGISEDGTTIVGQTGTDAFRWTDTGGVQLLGSGRAWDASGDGSIVVGRANVLSGIRASIWDATNGTQFLDDVLTSTYGLDLTGWSLQQAIQISDNGQIIAGLGTFNGGSSAWLVDLGVTAVPLPATAWLFGSGFIGLVGLARRNKA